MFKNEGYLDAEWYRSGRDDIMNSEEVSEYKEMNGVYNMDCVPLNYYKEEYMVAVKEILEKWFPYGLPEKLQQALLGNGKTSGNPFTNPTANFIILNEKDFHKLSEKAGIDLSKYDSAEADAPAVFFFIRKVPCSCLHGLSRAPHSRSCSDSVCISLNHDSLALNAGYSAPLSAAVSPNNATDKAVLWTSSNPLVASVDSSGGVTAWSEGSAEIIARTLEASDKQFTAKCKVNVTGTVAPADDVTEAEDHNVQSGIDTEDCSEGGSDVAFIENGDYIGFHGMNFGRSAAFIDFRVGANSSGGAIEVRLGAPDGKLIGSMDVSSTGGWQTWKTQRCAIDPTVGVNDVYFVFKGGEGYLFNLNWLRINCPYENDDLPGDCNLDGAVTTADAVMLQKWLLTESDVMTSWRHADINKDNSLSAADLTLLKQLILNP